MGLNLRLDRGTYVSQAEQEVTDISVLQEDDTGMGLDEKIEGWERGLKRGRGSPTATPSLPTWLLLPPYLHRATSHSSVCVTLWGFPVSG